MAEAQEGSQRTSSYIFDAENAAEMARLINQDRILTRCMDGLFPPQLDLSNVHDILDIACGPGGWVMDVAKAYPDKRVTGIDVSQLMIEFARYKAASEKLHNVHFMVMDATRPLILPDKAFDFVNVRFISSFMLKAAWPALVKECFRTLRPGGIVRLTEYEGYISNSFAIEKLSELATRAIHKAGQGFSPGGWQVAITPMLGQFLKNAGFQHMQRAAHVVDGSAGSDEYLSLYQTTMAGFKLGQPFLIKMGVTTQQEVEALYQRALEEMMSPDYRALWYFLSVWGEKPNDL